MTTQLVASRPQESDYRLNAQGSLNDSGTLSTLLEKVYRETGYDFRGYKCGTVTRRFKRRLYAAGANTYLEYIQFLNNHPAEYERLTEDLTITVSEFFRNPDTFQQVARLVLPELLPGRRNGRQQSLRIWSAACAQGEEPYSIAIMLNEFLKDRLGDFNISLYATDISKYALHEAQAGLYSAKVIENLPHHIQKKYFTRQDAGYTINSNIRQMVKCSQLDLVSNTNSPFLNLDCIFCRNVLIYLQKQLQARVLGMLYNSLATPGYLVLGEVETPTDNLRGKLECLDSKAKIYVKKWRNDYV